MNESQAETAVTVSALIVFLIYVYRKAVEGSQPASGKSGTLAALIGQSKPPPGVGQFATAWGFLFLMISIAASVSPPFGGSFAILVATADVLSNAPNLFADVGGLTGGTSTGTTGSLAASGGMTAGSVPAVLSQSGQATTIVNEVPAPLAPPPGLTPPLATPPGLGAL